MLTCNCFWPESSGPMIHAIESIGIVAGWNSSSLAMIASCSLSFTSSISPEASYVAGLPGFSPTAFSLGSSAIVKVLGQNDTFVFWDSLVFWGKWLLIQNRFCAEKSGPRFFTFVSQSLFGAKVAWNLDISHPYPSTLQKTIHRIITIGVNSYLTLANKFHPAQKTQGNP